MIPYIPQDELHARRQKLADLLPKSSILILPAQPTTFRNSDTENPFRQESMFWYFTGINQPNALLVIYKNTAGITQFCLWLEKVLPKTEMWNGRRLSIPEAATVSGLSQVEYISKKTNTDVLHLLSKSRLVWVNNEGNASQTLAAVLPDVLEKNISNSPRITGILSQLRIYKSDWEMAQLRQAASINIQAHTALKNAISSKNPTHEHALQAELEYVWRSHGLTWAYPPIVAAGNNATTLHYGQNSATLQSEDLVLIDAGCEYNYYASDITRTVAISSPTEAQQIILDIVQKAHAAAFLAINQPGCTLSDAHKSATVALVDGLISHSILPGSRLEILNSQSYLEFWPHSIGHWLGLDTHDFGLYKNTDGDYFTLEKGMVFTIEPGLYIPLNSTTAPSKFRGIGVRLEDNVVVTKNGIENITQNLSLL